MSMNGDDEASNGRSDPEQGQRQNRRKKVRGGHKAHLTKMLGELRDVLDGYTSERESRILTLKSCLERKADIISKLDEEILGETEEETAIALEIEEAEDVQNKIRENIIRIEDVSRRMK